MVKTHKVMEMEYNGTTYVCIYNSTVKRNPYRLFEQWYEFGWHKKKIVEYEDFDSVLFYLLQLKYKHVHWDME